MSVFNVSAGDTFYYYSLVNRHLRQINNEFLSEY